MPEIVKQSNAIAEGRVAVVTGSAGGLGGEIVRGLHERGWSVVLTDRDVSATSEAAAQFGTRAESAELDVVDAAACRRMATDVRRRHGRLDLWINNAGVLLTGPPWMQDDEQRRLLVDVNVHGTVNGTLAALEVMRTDGRGHVINIASLAGLVAAPGETLYSATKHACMAFSIGTLHDLRRNGERKIHVSAVCPDGIWTPMLFDRADDPEAALSWSGVLLKPEVVAAHVLGVVERPRPVTSIPRRRGASVRVIDAFPRLSLAIAPVVMAEARRRQRAFRRRHLTP
jgi:NADP-dependent 3-hydroxy acid dehydrogenase YdfG